MKKINFLIFTLLMMLGLINIAFADTMSEIANAVNKWSQHYGIEPALIYAIIEQESNFNPSATGTSSDRGLMQVTPVAQADAGFSNLGYDIYDIDTNIMIGTAYLARIRDVYAKAYDIRKILSYYNTGNGKATYGIYANSVMVRYNKYKNGSGKILFSDNGTTATNACVVKGCGGTIADKWHVTEDGKHYKACTANHNHQYDIGEHTFANGKCTVCNKENNKENSNKNACIVKGCGGTIADKWHVTEDGIHFKACTVNFLHQYPSKEPHNFINGVCNLCGFKNIELDKTIKISTGEDNGALVINMDNNAIKMDGVTLVQIETKSGFPLLYKNELALKGAEKNTNRTARILNSGKCELQVMDARVAHLIKPDSLYAKELGNIEHEISVKIICNKVEYIGLAKIKANFNNIPIETQKVDTITNNSLFSDLPDNHWAIEDVKAMVEAGIVQGMGDGMLGTNNNITAEEFLVMLSRVVNQKGLAKKEGESYIPEGMDSEWGYQDYLNLTKALGNSEDMTKKLGEEEIKLILGNDDATVMKNYKTPITREKAANIMGAFINMDEQVSSANEYGFIDWNNVNSAYKKRLNSLKKRDIFKGTDNGNGTISANPTVEITRVEAIALINRLYKAL